MPRPKGRPRKDEPARDIVAEQAYEIQRLKMENEAWEKARELADGYSIDVNEDLIQDELDTYREWLHGKSKCRSCGLTCYQTTDGAYHCPRCENLM